MKRRLKITFTKVKRTNSPGQGTEQPAAAAESITADEIELLRRIRMRHLGDAAEGKPLPKENE